MEENVNVRQLLLFSGLICDRWLSLGWYSTTPSLFLTGKWHKWFDLTEHYAHLWSVACVGGAKHIVVVTLNRKTGRDFPQRTSDSNSKGSWAMLLLGSVYLHVDDQCIFESRDLPVSAILLFFTPPHHSPTGSAIGSTNSCFSTLSALRGTFGMLTGFMAIHSTYNG